GQYRSVQRLMERGFPMANIAKSRNFVQFFTRLIDEVAGDEEHVFIDGKALLSELITYGRKALLREEIKTHLYCVSISF
ncbi:MAG: hypothetical protein ACE5I0_10960, partial [Candidatus Binatia bacterium]